MFFSLIDFTEIYIALGDCHFISCVPDLEFRGDGTGTRHTSLVRASNIDP